ncbi:hypothetical protein [Klebsiella aerogenes]|uniref:hypothetical protein n=1 Tax=Klebsiella aerogenes TaxID=548 RepID=UPI0012DE8563|nr:hypothetical protein [Klebsiella aerogenes]
MHCRRVFNDEFPAHLIAASSHRAGVTWQLVNALSARPPRRVYFFYICFTNIPKVPRPRADDEMPNAPGDDDLNVGFPMSRNGWRSLSVVFFPCALLWAGIIWLALRMMGY